MYPIVRHRDFNSKRNVLQRAVTVLPVAFFLLFLASGNAQETRRAGTISGQIADQANGVLQDATVALLNGSSSVRLQQTRTGADGAFTFENVPSGDYVLEVRRTGFAQAEERISMTIADSRFLTRISRIASLPIRVIRDRNPLSA